MRNIKVYLADASVLQDEALYRRLYGLVSPQRREKIERYSQRDDQILSLAAGVLMEKALAKEGIDCTQVWYGPNGKPYIEGLYFNLSHGGNRVMCVISDREVGCDVEAVRNFDLYVAKRYFCRTEWDIIRKQPEGKAQLDMFFRMWTLKESFMKATGKGMALGLDAFQIEICGENVFCRHQFNEEVYHFKEYDFADGYKYAVCGLSADFEEAEWMTFA